MDLTVLIPAYEEAENLALLLPRLRRACAACTSEFELLVVDTMEPKDATPAVCAEHGARYVARQGGNAYGDAVRTGIRQAQGSRVLCMDADGSHEPECIPTLYARRHDADVVVASRYVSGGRTDNSWVLRAMSHALNLSYRWILRIPCADVSNSFKLYRGAQLQALTLHCHHFDIVEEVLIRLIAQFPSARIVEVPTHFRQRVKGVTKRNLRQFILSYWKTMWRLRALQQRALRSPCKREAA